MPDLSRRTLLRTVGVAGVAGVAALGGYEVESHRRPPSPRRGAVTARAHSQQIIEENARTGSTGWRFTSHDPRSSNDALMQISGFTSTASVLAGGSIDFHVSVNREQPFTIDIYRLGWYGGKGGRHLASSPRLAGRTQPPPDLDPVFGTITCPWAKSWTLKVPSNWVSGLYVGVMTSAAGHRSCTPFVVRNSRPADLLVIVPFMTYQAYNLFPVNGRLGKSLYYGYSPAALDTTARPDINAYVYDNRAVQVSFDRPFANEGWPHRADEDQSFAYWAEHRGYDMTYATSLDLHSGRLDLSQYRGIVFSGHDEYWSQPMRDQVTTAVAKGTSLAYMSANNLYWHVRCDAPTAVGEVRSMHCYKTSTDPTPDASGQTTQWRLLGPAPTHAEQGLLGVQYNGIVETECPLIVQQADHWVWSGTGVRNGDALPRVVGGEADGFTVGAPSPSGATQALLSASPFKYRGNNTRPIQNTSVCEMPSGATVFVAASMNWTWALGKPSRIDHRIQTATANVFGRILRTQAA
jgi:hypothetical protein